jgi:inner membrane protein
LPIPGSQFPPSWFPISRFPFPAVGVVVDNITHTLVGAALAEAGLKKRTALGGATLMIAANFPDIDIVAAIGGYNFGARRGITHGFLALAVLPFVLAGLMWAWDVLVRRRSNASLPAADFRQLVILSFVGMITHPTLDFMNTYGMRWLMPFVDKWFYADGMFIVDPWFMLMLAAGVWFSRRWKSVDPARVALASAGTYVIVMLCITTMGRSKVFMQVGPRRFMVEPTPGIPWRRGILVDEGLSYRFGTYTAFGQARLGDVTIAKGNDDPAVGIAREMAQTQAFLNWARFPFYRVVRDKDGTLVRIADARYTGDDARGWAAIEVRIPVNRQLAGRREEIGDGRHLLPSSSSLPLH